MRAFLCCFAVLLLLPQCGAGPETSGEAKSAADEQEGTKPKHEAADSDSGEEEPVESTGAAEKSKLPSCEDGTCSPCGNGMCPAGWYCDEKASGGSACSWLAECAEKPTCSCVTRVLGSSCKCREESGGLKVACE